MSISYLIVVISLARVICYKRYSTRNKYFYNSKIFKMGCHFQSESFGSPFKAQTKFATLEKIIWTYIYRVPIT